LKQNTVGTLTTHTPQPGYGLSEKLWVDGGMPKIDDQIVEDDREQSLFRIIPWTGI